MSSPQTIPTISAEDVSATGGAESVASTSHGAEEWRNWPENSRTFRPWLENPSDIRKTFEQGEREDAFRSTSTEVFHVTEYSGEGEKLLDQFQTEQQSAQYLTTQQQEGGIRIFFASADFGRWAPAHSYMRRWFHHYSVPMDAAVAFIHSPAVFRTFTEDLPVPRGAPRRRIIHLWFSCYLSLPPLSEEQREYCKGDTYEYYSKPENYNLPSDTFSSSIYVQYDTLSRGVTVLCVEFPPIYRALCRACEGASFTMLLANPFMFPVLHLQCLRTSFRSICHVWYHDLIDYTNDISPKDYSHRLQLLATERMVSQRSLGTLNLLVDCVGYLRDEHRQFTATWDLAEDSFEVADPILRDMVSDFHSMVEQVRSFLSTSEGLTDILLGLTQIQNGESMHIVAEENQKQAAAAHADNEIMKRIAVDTKRDSEIMKTITVATLIYLPATFVCTLFSMGMFEWHSEDQAGGLTVAGWIYLAVTVPLTVMTCGIAWWKYLKSSERAEAELDTLSKRKWEDQNGADTPNSNKDEYNNQGQTSIVVTDSFPELIEVASVGGGATPIHPDTTEKRRQRGDVLPYISDRLQLLKRRITQAAESTNRAANPV